MGFAEVVAPFDAGWREFTALSPRLWGPLGQELVDRSAPQPGERVLDVCCGDGASAIPAAHAVGPTGVVDAIDGAAGLLESGRAAAPGLPHLRFVRADVTTWTPAEGPYDLVQSGFGVFFLPDMDAATKRLAGLLRPGGRLAVSTWRYPAIRAFAGCLVDAVEEVRGEPVEEPEGPRPSERIDDETKLADWLGSLGLADVRTWHVPFELPVDADLARHLVAGTGLRSRLDGFDETEVERVHATLLRRLADQDVHHLDAGTLIATGRRE